MTKIPAESWRPVDVENLDSIADRVVRSTENVVVRAGPGAGKTEMLAQRACFLLQTGLCDRPRRILALSYKRDAARNLRERVSRRAGEDAHRLVSVTLDSFSKDLLDRFAPALPPGLQLRGRYRVRFLDNADVQNFLTTLKLPSLPGDEWEVRAMKPQLFLNRHFCSFPLWPVREPRTRLEYAAAELFKLAHDREEPELDFRMIARLAEAVLIANTKLLRALRAAFSHVFIDEFQDTTSIQYATLRTAFGCDDVCVTAVGDDKQRIMGWAGALDDAFQLFERDFRARPEHPVVNYRAAPELIDILAHLAAAITGVPTGMQPAAKSLPGGECEVLIFPSDEDEARAIAERVERWVREEKIAPGEICVLVRQKTPQYGARVAEALTGVGVRVRIESPDTEFLTSQVVADLASVLRIAIHGSAPDEWERIRQLLRDLGQVPDERRSALAERAFLAFANELGSALHGSGGSRAELKQHLEAVIEHFGVEEYLNARGPQTPGESLGDVLNSLADHVERVFKETADWGTVVDDVAGIAFVPVMTIHKAKGREYHTVIFVGLEDDAFWSYRQDPDEATRSFFVAFSRARRRVLFTFASSRQGDRQSLQTIKPLYEMLRGASVPFRKYDATTRTWTTLA